MAPTFTVIMTSFNYAPYIGAAIESVLVQTFQDWELLIVDDCSTDDSWRVIQDFKDPRIKSHRHQVNLGACAAYNQALSIAQGKYIACLDSDDLFMPDKLERQAEFLERHPEIDICGTFIMEIDSNGANIVQATPHAEWFNITVDLNDPSTWLWQNRVCHSGAVVRKDLHDRLGEFDNGLVYTPDWQFWLRALVAGARFTVIQESLVAYRNHGNNITHKNKQGTLLEHAKTCTHVLIPWLKQQGRLDLIETTVQGFLANAEFISSNELQRGVERELLSGLASYEVGVALMSVAVQRQALILAKESYLAEVLEGKAWLEGQLKAGQAELLAKESHLAAVLERKALLEQQICDLSGRLERIEGAFTVRALRKLGVIPNV
jgi:glycosyltransferase involved in cell wall biosynthesis